MKVMISGVAGFLGSHLAKRFLDEGNVVLGVDNMSTGSISNISCCFKYPKFEFYEQDINDFSYHKPDLDIVIHLASPASPKHFNNMQMEIALVNSQGTRNMLELAKVSNAVFLLSSTSECYGDPKVTPQIETYFGNVDNISVRGVYDESKRFAETLAMVYHRTHGLDVRIARIFNAYGPQMLPNDGRVIPNFINQCLAGDPITVYGDGTQTRSFCYVTDIVTGLYELATAADSVGLNSPLNIGNPSEITILQLAHMVKGFMSSDSELAFKPIPEGDPCCRCPNIERIRAQLGWEPKVNLEQGLIHTINYFKKESSIFSGKMSRS